MASISVDRQLIVRLCTFLRIIFPINSCCHIPSSVFLAIAVFIISAADQFATYYVGLLPSEFYVALGSRNIAAFRYLTAKSAIIILVKAFILAASKYFTSRFFLVCRSLCARKLHKLYFHRQAYYHLDVSPDKCDNPDQRMTQDIEKLTRIFTNDLFSTVTISPFIIAYYSYLTKTSSGWFGPLAIYGYFASSTIINKLLLSPIIRLVSEQEKKEGDLRARHLEVRTNIEAIAFFRADDLENTVTDEKLDALFGVQKKLFEWRSFLCLATSIFDYYGGTLSYLIIAIPIFVTNEFDGIAGVDLSGIISKNVFFYLYLIFSFTRLIGLAENFGDLAGVTNRVIGLYEDLRELHRSSERGLTEKDIPIKGDKQKSSEAVKLINSSLDETFIEKNSSADDSAVTEESEEYLAEISDSDKRPLSDIAITMKSVDIACPKSSDILLKDISLRIGLQRNILITGDSSAGKTSLLRVLANLWQPIAGEVQRHWKVGANEMLFMPQNPYFPNGCTTLRQQIAYPCRASGDVKEISRLIELVRAVRMDHVLERLSGFDEPIDGDWSEKLSRGELQRLCIARLLYHQPKLAFLDECTSAVGSDMEVSLYQLIQEANINFVSVGHRSSLKQFHDDELHLDGSGGWSIIRISEEEKERVKNEK